MAPIIIWFTGPSQCSSGLLPLDYAEANLKIGAVFHTQVSSDLKSFFVLILVSLIWKLLGSMSRTLYANKFPFFCSFSPKSYPHSLIGIGKYLPPLTAGHWEWKSKLLLWPPVTSLWWGIKALPHWCLSKGNSSHSALTPLTLPDRGKQNAASHCLLPPGWRWTDCPCTPTYTT